jgi:predicted metallopeptidase
MKILPDNSVVKILIRRDKLSVDEAVAQVQGCSDRIEEAIQGGDLDLEEIILEDLGLEPDYIFELIDLGI